MSREIKFRGYSETYQKWYYGYYLKNQSDSSFIRSIDDFDTYWVLEETVGQFTGIYSKDGTEIYEGDILRFPPKNNWEKTNFSCFEVFFHDGDGNSDYNIGYSLNRMHNHGAVCGGYIPAFKPKIVSQMIVIGNIYENPELLERKQ